MGIELFPGFANRQMKRSIFLSVLVVIPVATVVLKTIRRFSGFPVGFIVRGANCPAAEWPSRNFCTEKYDRSPRTAAQGNDHKKCTLFDADAARARRSHASKGIAAKVTNKTSRIASAVAMKMLLRHRKIENKKIAEPTMLNKSIPSQDLGEQTHLGVCPGVSRKIRCNHETLSIFLIA